MPSVFSKNCILTGIINYYCLLCSKHFTDEEPTLTHILDPLHKQNLCSNGYFEKYKEHYIRKLKDLYFCELCSKIFPTAAKVGLHVLEESHITKKKLNVKIIREENNVLVNGKLISDDAWNGMKDDTCFVCNVEYDDISKHKCSESHIIKLIKNELIYHENHVYRKIDDGWCYCLTCNTTELESQHLEHTSGSSKQEISKLQSEEHESETLNNNNKIETGLKQELKDKETEEVNIDNQNKSTIQKTKRTKVKKMQIKKENHIEIDKPVEQGKSAVELDKIYCKTLGADNYIAGSGFQKFCILCERDLDVSPTEHIQSKHHQILLKMHNERLISKNASKDNDLTADKENKVGISLASGMKTDGSQKTTLYSKPVHIGDTKSSRSEEWTETKMEEYAKQHGLTFNRPDNSFYCRDCSRRLSTTRDDIDKHITSQTHKEKKYSNTLKKQYLRKPIKKIPINTFIKDIKVFETVKDRVDIVINGAYCVSAYSFNLIVRNGSSLSCITCKTNFKENCHNDPVLVHISTDGAHQKAVAKSCAITTVEDEFIREIKGDFHCGFCNIVEKDWEDMLEHLATTEHKKSKINYQVILHKYKTENTQPDPLFNQMKIFF